MRLGRVMNMSICKVQVNGHPSVCLSCLRWVPLHSVHNLIATATPSGLCLIWRSWFLYMSLYLWCMRVFSMWRVNKYMHIRISNHVCWRWEENGGLTLANGERIRPIQESRIVAVWTWGLRRSRLGIRLLLGEQFWSKAETLASPEIWVSEKLKLSKECRKR